MRGFIIAFASIYNLVRKVSMPGLLEPISRGKQYRSPLAPWAVKAALLNILFNDHLILRGREVMQFSPLYHGG